MLRAPFLMADGGAAAGAADPSSEQGGDNGSKNAEQPKTLEDLLNEHAEYRSEIDRRVNKAVETATAKERERQKIIQDRMQDEVLRVSKMTSEEKDAYMKQKAEDEARKREADLTRRELTLDARAALADKKLPDAFVDLLNYTDKDACLKSIDTLDKAFNAAVQTAVNDKLKGSAPPKDASSEGTSTQSEQEKALAEARARIGIKK